MTKATIKKLETALKGLKREKERISSTHGPMLTAKVRAGEHWKAKEVGTEAYRKAYITYELAMGDYNKIYEAYGKLCTAVATLDELLERTREGGE